MCYTGTYSKHPVLVVPFGHEQCRRLLGLNVHERLRHVAAAAASDLQAGMICFITLQQSVPSQMTWQDSNAFREH